MPVDITTVTTSTQVDIGDQVESELEVQTPGQPDLSLVLQTPVSIENITSVTLGDWVLEMSDKVDDHPDDILDFIDSLDNAIQ